MTVSSPNREGGWNLIFFGPQEQKLFPFGHVQRSGRIPMASFVRVAHDGLA
jgi:hypothetical protein